MRIIVTNPNYVEVYETDDLTMSRWENFLFNFSNGNEMIISFTDKLSGNHITLIPGNFASIEVFCASDNKVYSEGVIK